jgi:hypothetical protein
VLVEVCALDELVADGSGVVDGVLDVVDGLVLGEVEVVDGAVLVLDVVLAADVPRLLDDATGLFTGGAGLPLPLLPFVPEATALAVRAGAVGGTSAG